MKDLKILQDEISYNTNGEGEITQTGVANLVGVNKSTVSRCIQNNLQHLNVNENNQIHESSLLTLLRLLSSNNPQVLDIVIQIETIGVRSVFHEVQHPKNTVQNSALSMPMSELFRIAADLHEQKEQLEMVVDEKNIITNNSNEWYPVSWIRKLNPNTVISAKRLSATSESMGIKVKTLFSPYDGITANTYNVDVWKHTYPSILI